MQVNLCQNTLMPNDASSLILVTVLTLILVSTLVNIWETRRKGIALLNSNKKIVKTLIKTIEDSEMKLTKVIVKRSKQDFRQLEALVSLHEMLDLKAALPPTRGWAASPDLLLTLTSLVRKHKPKLVVELGSGASTIILSRAGAVEIVAIEHDLEYLKNTQELLTEHQVSNVKLIHAPLIQKEILEESFMWYDSSKLQDLKEIDFLFIDGPPGSKDDAARFPALPVLGSKLSKNAVVVIDDTKRSGEKTLAESFASALPNHKLRFLDHEKGTAIIEPL